MKLNKNKAVILVPILGCLFVATFFIAAILWVYDTIGERFTQGFIYWCNVLSRLTDKMFDEGTSVPMQEPHASRNQYGFPYVG